jgi:integrase
MGHYKKKDTLYNHLESHHSNLCQWQCLLCHKGLASEKRYRAHAAACNGSGAPRPEVTSPLLPVQLPLAQVPTVVAPPSLQVVTAAPGSAQLGLPLDSLPGVDGFLESQNRTPAIITKVRYLLNTASTFLGRPTAGLSDVVQDVVVSGLFSYLQEAGRKAESLYQYSLVMKKIMEYLAERQTIATRQPHLAKEFPTWRKVEQINKLTNKKRKCDVRDRAAGINQSRTPNIMSDDELLRVREGTFVVMRDYEHRHLTTPLSTDDIKWYTSCLVTAMLLLGLAPRQQVLQVLTPSRLLPPRTGLNESDTQYEVRVSAHDSKDGNPVLVYLHEDLTPHLNWYLRTVLPPGHQGPIFRQRGNEPREDFTPLTTAVTSAMIGKRITCHAFRSSIATAFGDAPEEMRRNLARAMNHSFEVHEKVYTRQNKRMKTQSAIQEYLWSKRQ